MKLTKGEKIFGIFNTFFMLLLIIVTIYPLVYVLFASFSDPKELLKHTGLIFYPLGKPTLKGYEMVFQNPNILVGYRNTIFYVVVGTFLSLVMTTLTAFILSRRDFYIKKTLMIMIIITMFFGGGLIPYFLVVKNIGLYDKFYTLAILGMLNSYNMIIMRTFFSTSIPYSLEEAAMIEGANDFHILTQIIIPLSKPVIAVMVLYYGVARWNSWFEAFIFTRSREYIPLQLVLREILMQSQNQGIENAVDQLEESYMKELIRYCTIIVATVPILAIYPFLQRYFVKGVMIGALKG